MGHFLLGGGEEMSLTTPIVGVSKKVIFCKRDASENHEHGSLSKNIIIKNQDRPMKHSYSIACKTCNVSLWIGQGWPFGKVYIYKNKDVLKKLESFLFGHQDHDLVFGNNENWDYQDEEELSEVKSRCASICDTGAR